jgi:hypothetical protein
VSVPAITRIAESPSATAGPASATISAVSSGPVTNEISIPTESSANAARRLAGSETRSGQRERRTAPAGGKAAPAISATPASAAAGAAAAPRPQIESTAAACRAASGTSMPTPRRSTTRAAAGAPTALPRASAPVTSPAVANDSPTSRRKRITASPLIANGSRITIVAAKSTATSGTRSRRA